MSAISSVKSQPRAEMSWHVIDMARRDGPRSVSPDGFAARMARSLFGMTVPGPLADGRLEALRRFSVRAWFWESVPAKDVQNFFNAGYTATHAERILNYVAHHRGFTPSLLLSPA